MLISALGFWMQFTSLTYFLGVTLEFAVAKLAELGPAGSHPVDSDPAARAGGRIRRRSFSTPPHVVDHERRPGLARTLARVRIARSRTVGAPGSARDRLGFERPAQSFDNPARNSWISFLVPRPLISNAIGLNSVAANIPLMVGPALAGI